MYKIIIKRKPQKYLDKLSAEQLRRISNAILDLKYDPANTDIKNLKGKFKGMYRMRTGPYRILFTKDTKKQEVTIYIIDKRGDIY